MIDTKTTEANRPALSAHDMKIADAVWVATATMHRESPGKKAFDRNDIAEKTKEMMLTNADYKSIWRHVDHHCVANREPMPNRPRILFDTGVGGRRLFRDGDWYSSAREGSPTHPDWDTLPSEFTHLRTWYEQDWNKDVDQLLALIGTGKEIWKDEHADQYVENLRKEW